MASVVNSEEGTKASNERAFAPVHQPGSDEESGGEDNSVRLRTTAEQITTSVSNQKKVHYERGTKGVKSHAQRRDSSVESGFASDRASLGTVDESPFTHEQIEDQRHILSAVQVALDAANEKIRVLEAHHSKLNVDLVEGNQENRSLKREKEDLINKVEESLRALSDERKINERLSPTTSRSEVETLRAGIASLEANNRDTNAVFESMMTANDELSKELNNQQIASIALLREQSLKQEIELAKRNNEWLEEELKTKNAESLKYRKEKNARIAELERLNEEATSNVETLKKIEQDLRNRLDEVQKEAEDGHLHAQLEAQVREVSRLEDLLADEEDNNEKLKEKIRIMRRGGADDGDRVRFEEKVLEAELLRVRVAEREELVRLAETRVAEKNRTILYLKNYLRTHGFRVEDDTVGELKTESELKTSVTDSDLCLLRGCEGVPVKNRYCENHLCEMDNCKYPTYYRKLSGDPSPAILSTYCPIHECRNSSCQEASRNGTYGFCHEHYTQRVWRLAWTGSIKSLGKKEHADQGLTAEPVSG